MRLIGLMNHEVITPRFPNELTMLSPAADNFDAQHGFLGEGFPVPLLNLLDARADPAKDRYYQ